MTKSLLFYLFFFTLLFHAIATPKDHLLYKLRSHRLVRLKTILHQISEMSNLDNQDTMQLDILSDFFKKALSNDRQRTYTWISVFLEQNLSQFRKNWIRQMYLKLMIELNFDMNNRVLIEEALKHPKKFSLDYQTYKVLIRPLEQSQ